MLVSSPLVLLAHPSLPANNVQELIALAKKKPGSLNIGSGGYGTSTHMSGEVFKRAADIDIVHVPFQGVAPAMTALVGGQVDLYFGGTSTALPYLQSGKLKAIAVTGEKRNPLLPDVPTFKEAGVSGVNTDTYWGIYAPSGTPNDRVQALNAYFTKALKDPDVVKRMGELGLVQIGNSADAHTAQMREMISKWTDDIRQAGIKPN
jgi:tripartite-type tricarboxylate transporter receptor subunit TctC